MKLTKSAVDRMAYGKQPTNKNGKTTCPQDIQCAQDEVCIERVAETLAKVPRHLRAELVCPEPPAHLTLRIGRVVPHGQGVALGDLQCHSAAHGPIGGHRRLITNYG